jgi:tRNA-binding protein
VNFPKKANRQVHERMSCFGAVGADGDVILLCPDFKIENGLRIG